MPNYLVILLFFSLSLSSWAANRVTIQVSPINKAVKENIENQIGNYKDDSRTGFLYQK